MTMLEKAARAVAGKFAVDWDTASADKKESAADIARAVLLAVQEPGIGTWIDADCDDDTHPVSCFTAIIDAILGE